MEDQINSNILINTIRMELDYYIEKSRFQPYPYLIVEGICDISFFKKICSKKCDIRQANGKENVIEVVMTLEQEDCKILGIIDSDFWNLENIISNSPNLLVTDFHDIEIMMIETQAFNSVLIEFGNSEKISEIEQIHDLSLKEILYNECKKIGYTRLFAKKNSDFEELNLKRLKFDNFFDYNNFTINEDRLIQTVLNNTDNWTLLKTNLDVIYATNIDVDFIKDLIHQLHDPYIDLRQLCRGHDLTKILIIGLIMNFGQIRNPNFPSNRRALESNLRIGYNKNDFHQTKLYLSIKNWENNNNGYLIL
ncbi:MAG: DUF4435 domain-containing protein [Candidatus Hermodarchaeota archaeon]